MLTRLTFNCVARIYFSANPVTLRKGQRSLKQCTLVVLKAVYICAKFEEIRYYSLQKTANVKIFTELILCQLSPPEFKKAQ